MASVADAAVGNAAGWAQVADLLAQTKEREAHGEDYRVLAQQRLLNLQRQQEQMAREQRAAQLEAGTVPPGATTPGAVGAAEAQQNPADLLQAQMKEDTKALARAVQMAQVYKSNGLFDRAREADIDAGKIRTNLVSSQKALRMIELDDAREVSSTAGAIVDQTTLDMALPILLSKNPRLAKAPFDRSFDNQIVYGPTTAKTLKGIAEMGRTAENKATDEIKAMNADSQRIRSEAVSARADADVARAAARVAESDSIIAKNQAAATRGVAQANLADARAGVITDPKAIKSLKEKALRPSTGQAIRNAEEAVIAELDLGNDRKFPAVRAFATDVSDVANRIVAENASRGDVVDYADAYSQAIALLKPNVQEKEEGLIFKNKTLNYKRPSKLPSGVEDDIKSNVPDAVLFKQMNDAGIKGSIVKGVVVGEGGKPVAISTKAQRDLLPVGTTYIANGKEWTKQ